MLRTTRFSTFKEEQIKKVKQLSSGIDMEVQIKDGELSILIKLIKNQPQDLTKSSVSSSTDHSFSDLDCQCKELQKLLDIITFN